jgi:mannosyltransferase
MKRKTLQFFRDHSLEIALVVVTVLGALLRLKGLTFNSYWLDEIYSVSFSNPSYSLKKVFEETTIIDVHPPFYQTLLWLWYKLFGYTELTGRLFSAIIGILGLPALYFLGKELFNKHVGLYASLIASLNYFLIYYSQETRSYALVFLLTVVSYLFFIRVVNEPRKRDLLLYWLTTILLLYTHYVAFFTVATQLVVFVYWFVRFPAKRKPLIVPALLSAALFIVSLLPIASYIPLDREKLLFWVSQPSVLFFVSYIYKYFQSAVLFVLFGFGGLASLFYLLSKRASAKEAVSLSLLLIWMAGGYLLLYLKGVVSSPILVPRYTIFIVPALLLFVSYGIWRLGPVKREALLSVVVLFSFYQLFHGYYSVTMKDQWRDAIENVSRYAPLPVYENWPYNGWADKINHYQTYADLLRIDIEIMSNKKLAEDIKNDTLPDCFWVLDARDPEERYAEILKDGAVQKVFETDLKGAEGMLFSHKTEPGICADRAGIDRKNEKTALR